MRASQFLAVLAAIPAVLGASRGFNTGATFSDGSIKQQQDFENEFNAQRNLAGTNGTFTSARLYTMIQGDTNGVISAIPAAIATQTTLLLGLWASAGAAQFTNEVNQLTAAINEYGTAFTDLVVGISAGSEDLYRTSSLGVESNAGPGATPDEIVGYINQVRGAIANTPLSAALVGHVDTYNMYTNSSNSAVIAAADFLGTDAYPYYEGTKANGIENAHYNFFDDIQQVVNVAGGKPVWITETGWPTQGPTISAAVPSVQNAQTYYDQIACQLFNNNVNTWWFILQDQQPVVPASGVVFAVTGAGNPPPTQPLYDLSC